MKSYLNKPFPFIDKKKHRIVASFLFSAFIYLFLIVFQPFGIADIQFYKPLFILGFSVITLTVLLFNLLLVPYFFQQTFNTDNWTIKKNILFISFQFLVIAILNWAYNSTIGLGITVQYSLLYFVFITLSVGIIPTLFLNHFIEKYLNLRNQNIAEDLSTKLHYHSKEKKLQEIKILSENKNEEIEINLNQFICARSEGNYIKVYFKSKNGIDKKLIRNSISKITEQLLIFESIKRCHRSYIVNLENVVKVSGNARNFNLHIDDLEFTIPVSRSFPVATINKINHIN